MWENHQCESQAGQSRSLRIKPNPKPKKCLWILPFHSKVPSYPACPMVWAGSCWNTFIFLFMGQIHWIIILYNNAAASPLFRWKLQWMLVALLWLWIRLLFLYKVFTTLYVSGWKNPSGQLYWFCVCVWRRGNLRTMWYWGYNLGSLHAEQVLQPLKPFLSTIFHHSEHK